MKMFLRVITFICFVIAFPVVVYGKSAIHEIEAAVIILTGVVAMIGEGVLIRLDELTGNSTASPPSKG